MLNDFSSLYRNQILPVLEEVSVDVELKSKLDWMEYNKLLK